MEHTLTLNIASCKSINTSLYEQAFWNPVTLHLAFQPSKPQPDKKQSAPLSTPSALACKLQQLKGREKEDVAVKSSIETIHALKDYSLQTDEVQTSILHDLLESSEEGLNIGNLEGTTAKDVSIFKGPIYGEAKRLPNDLYRFVI